MGVGAKDGHWGCENPTTHLALDPTTLMPRDPTMANLAASGLAVSTIAEPTLVQKFNGMVSLVTSTVHTYTAPYTGESPDGPPSVATYLVVSLPALLLLAVPLTAYVVRRTRERTPFSAALTEPLFDVDPFMKPQPAGSSSWWPAALTRDVDEYTAFEENTCARCGSDDAASVGAA
jgi:hypothetical protein